MDEIVGSAAVEAVLEGGGIEIIGAADAQNEGIADVRDVGYGDVRYIHKTENFLRVSYPGIRAAQKEGMLRSRKRISENPGPPSPRAHMPR